jgi:serine/threonine-protein kinase
LRTIFEGTPILDGKYRLLQLLGAGGGGHVYKCRHLGLKRLVAVKVLRPQFAAQPQHMARFRREAEILGHLRHPHIVEVTDFGVDAERKIPYLVMEYLEGETLSERIRNHGPLELADALVIFEQIASGIDHVHAAGVLHRDLRRPTCS